MKPQNSSYKYSSIGNGEFEFTTEPAIRSFLGVGIIVGLFLAIPTYGLGLLLIYFVPVWVRGWWYKKQACGPFRVSSDNIELATGEKIPASKVHRVVLRNELAKSIEMSAGTRGPQAIVGGTGVMGAAVVAGAVVTQSMNAWTQYNLNKNTAVAYFVAIEAGGKQYSLAKGLDETTANGLMNDVHSALNGQLQ